MKINLSTVHPETGEIKRLNAEELQTLIKLKQFYREGVGFCDEYGVITKKTTLLCYRGITKDQLKNNLAKNDESVGTLLARLFYFGDKARHYRSENSIINESDYLKNINDVSKGTCDKIFDQIRKLRKSKVPAVKNFIDLHNEFFSFFDRKENKSIFFDAINENGEMLRDYYLQLLHTVGDFGINRDKTVLISTSANFSVARSFAKHSTCDSYIIVSVVRPGSFAQSIDFPDISNLPRLPKDALFPHQKELSIRGAIFPHNILSVIELTTNSIVFNPGLFTDENKNNNPFKTPIIIDQENFLETIRNQTNYNRWLYTHDFLNLFHGELV